MLNNIDTGTIVTLLTLVFTGGVLYNKLLALEKKSAKQEEDYAATRYDHIAQEEKIATLDKRVAVLEAKHNSITKWLGNIDKTLKEIVTYMRDNKSN